MRSELIVTSEGVREVKAFTTSNPASWFVDYIRGGEETDSGATVNWKTSLGLSAVWYCVNRIANDIAQMPLCLYRQMDDAAEEDETHPAGRLVGKGGLSPISPFHLRKLVQSHALLCGNGRAYVVRNSRRQPIDLIPLPQTTQTVTIYDTVISQRSKWHVVFPEENSPEPYEPIPLPDADVIHVFGLSHDGYCGLSPLSLMRNVFGLSIAGEKTGNRFFRNNAVPSLILEAPPGIFRNEQDAQTFLLKFNEYHQGLNNTGRVAMLREGVKATPLSIPFREAQMLEQREFQVREIMRAFGIPHIPGVTDSQSYNTLEQLNRAYLLHCLGPWLKAWTSECDRKLLTEAERMAGLYFDFDTWELVKPDAAQRAEMLGKLVTNMIITSNEAREWEGLPPIAGGDELRNPATSNNTTMRAPPEQQSTTSIDQPDSQQAEQDSVTATLRPLLAEEIADVREMATKARNFIDWLESHYEKLTPRLVAYVESCGGIADTGVTWAASHKSELIEAAGKVTRENLASAVTEVTRRWPAALHVTASTIINTRAP